MKKGRKKKLLPVDTPSADVLRALRNRMAKDVEIMTRLPGSAKDAKLYPLDECIKGVEWLTWLENEKRNEEKRLWLQGEIDGLGREGEEGNAEAFGQDDS